MKVYKIRNKEGKYSPSGCTKSYRFKSKGKVWIGTGPLRNHLKLYNINDISDDWIVEEYELVKIKEYNAKEFVQNKEKKENE
jgi:hypothetical protein